MKSPYLFLINEKALICQPRMLVLLSGLIHISLPNTTAGPTTEVWLEGGKNGLLIGTDTADISTYGHITSYPSDCDSIGFGLLFPTGYIPPHTVLYNGPCQWPELVGV